MNTQAKVTAEHLRKQAILYVRQSTLHQVKENRESTALQYDLKRHEGGRHTGAERRGQGTHSHVGLRLPSSMGRSEDVSA